MKSIRYNLLVVALLFNCSLKGQTHQGFLQIFNTDFEKKIHFIANPNDPNFKTQINWSYSSMQKSNNDFFTIHEGDVVEDFCLDFSVEKKESNNLSIGFSNINNGLDNVYIQFDGLDGKLNIGSEIIEFDYDLDVLFSIEKCDVNLGVFRDGVLLHSFVVQGQIGDKYDAKLFTAFGDGPKIYFEFSLKENCTSIFERYKYSSLSNEINDVCSKISNSNTLGLMYEQKFQIVDGINDGVEIRFYDHIGNEIILDNSFTHKNRMGLNYLNIDFNAHPELVPVNSNVCNKIELIGINKNQTYRLNYSN